MRLSRRHRDHELGFRLTPLIDVVFLLIIFFMTISQISRTNAHLIQVPQTPPTWNDAESTLLAFTVDREGNLTVNGESVGLDVIDRMVADQIARVGGDASKISTLLRYDHRCPSKLLNELVRRLAAGGATNVRLAVTAE